MKRLLIVVSLILLGVHVVCESRKKRTEDVPRIGTTRGLDLPRAETFRLANGFTTVVVPDHRRSLVDIQVWFPTGSNLEGRGQYGFAHLFEHLLFNRTKCSKEDYINALLKVGVSTLNGSTKNFYTRYFETLPKSSLEVGLWWESCRVGFPLLDQSQLDEQRGVVKNEKRQRENRPYGMAWNAIYEATYPPHHPYAHHVIGNYQDIDSVTLKDAQQWFRDFYGPQNAALVLTGDITVAEARPLVEKYFGGLEPGHAAGTRTTLWAAKMTGSKRGHIEDANAPAPRLYRIWNLPPMFDHDTVLLEIVATALHTQQTGRLYQRLFVNEPILAELEVAVEARPLGSQFVVQATAKPRIGLERIEAVINEELERLAAQGPTSEELERAKNALFAKFARQSETLGGFSGKGAIVAESVLFGGSPTAYACRLRAIDVATSLDVRDAVRAWIRNAGAFTLEVVPLPAYQASKKDVDRTKAPPLGQFPPTRFPVVSGFTLDNGLRVKLATMPKQGMVTAKLVVNGGWAADPADKHGRASLASELLGRGTASRGEQAFNEALVATGVQLGTGSDPDHNTLAASMPTHKFEQGMELLADAALRPAFDPDVFKRAKDERLAGIALADANPGVAALRIASVVVYGAGPYAQPFDGRGTKSSVESLIVDDVRRFHRGRFTPGNATLVVAGDITLNQLRAVAERFFGGWSGDEPPSAPESSIVEGDGQRTFVKHRTGTQSVIVLATLAELYSEGTEEALRTAMVTICDAFSSRIYQNLREVHGWSYGITCNLWNVRGKRLFIISAPVQSDKTVAAMREIARELDQLAEKRPITSEELEGAIRYRVPNLNGFWEASSAVAEELGKMAAEGRSDAYFVGYDERVRRDVTIERVNAAVRTLIPDHRTWVVVGPVDASELVSFGTVKVVE